MKQLILDTLRYRRFFPLLSSFLASVQNLNRINRKRHFLLGRNEFFVYTGTSDIYTVSSNFASKDNPYLDHGTWKVPVNFAFHKLITILDVGANIGASTVKLALHFPGSKIFAIEPLMRNFDLLAENTTKYQDITCFRYAIGSEDKIVSIGIESSTSKEWQAKVSENNVKYSEQVMQLSMQSFLMLEKIQNVDILKINVEGLESEILSTFSEWHSRVTIMAIAIRSSEDFESISKVMEHLLKFRPSRDFVYHLADSRILWIWPRGIPLN